MSICTGNIAKAIPQEEGTPIEAINKPLEPVNSRKGFALSPYPELNQDPPEHLDDRVIFFGEHFGE